MRYLFGALCLGTSLVIAYAALLLMALGCDDACNGDSGGWPTDGTAWLVVVGPLLACALLAAVIAGKELLVIAALCLEAAVTAVLVGLVAAGATLIDGASQGVLALAFLPVLLGAAALAALHESRRRVSGP